MLTEGNKRYGYFLILLFVPLLFFVLSCAGNSQKALDQSRIHYRMALDLDGKGESTQALAQAIKAYKINPKDSEINNFLGLAYTRNKMFAKAEMHFKKAIQLNPEYSEAMNNLCVLYIQQRRYDDAIEIGLKAVENITYLSPERAYNNIGWAYYKKGDDEDALKYFKRSLMHNKAFFLPHMNIAKIYFEKGKYEKAKQSYEASIEGCKECSVLYYDLGLTLLKLKDQKGAVRIFEECTKLTTNDEYGQKCKSKLAMLK